MDKRAIKKIAWIAALAVILGPVGFAQKTDDTSAAPDTEQSQSNISADEMEMDMKNGRAVFSGNVIISDDSMTLTCDRMTVFFAKEQKISRVAATGHVVILEPRNQRKATAEKAEYDFEKGIIKLIGSPVLEMKDRKMYDAGTISYDLTSETVKTTRIEGSDIRPKIVFKTDSGEGFSLDKLTGGKDESDSGDKQKSEPPKESADDR